MSDHEFCFGETCCSDPLPTAIATAIENAPKFYPGNRVLVRGNIEGQNRATVIDGPRELLGQFGQPVGEAYLIDFDHATGYPRWTFTKHLARLDVCVCGDGCTAGEGELHYGPQPTPNDPRIWKGTVAEFFEDAANRIEKAQ